MPGESILTPGDEPILALEDVTMVYSDRQPGTAALAGVSLTVDRGDFVAVLGPSGSGKTTLLRIIGDLLGPSTGRVRVCGHDPSTARRKREYGIVFQAPVLFSWRTVNGNVHLPLELAGTPRAERDQLVAEMLDQVGLRDYGQHYPRQLSGGMQQRVAIARALVVRPRLLLMDEPFGAVDELTRERLNLELLRLWRETGVTVLFVTHNIEEAVFLADRVVVLTPRPGRVAAEIRVGLDRPRGEETRADPAFFAVVNQARAAIRGLS